MANYKEQLRNGIWKAYQKEVSSDPVDLATVATWAIKKGLWKPRPVDITQSLANDLAQALREQKRTDKKGREYRAIIPVRVTKKGATLFEWADIDIADRAHVEKNVQQERRSIVQDCFALQMKIDHYNDHHSEEEPIQIVLDFEEDVEELKIAHGIEGDDEDVA